MNKEQKISLTIVIVTLVLIIMSFAFLPDTVQIQHSVYLDSSTTVPKIFGIALATICNLIGLFGILLSKSEPPKKYNILIASVIGTIIFVYMLIVNCMV